MFKDEIRRAAETAPRAALPAVTALLWRAFGEGNITEAEAEALSVLIEARTNGSGPSRPTSAGHASNPSRTSSTVTGEIPSDRQRTLRTGVGSRPRTDASMGRRRRWAASGRLPPALAARFTLAEHAVLALVAAEIARRGDCRLTIGHVAAVVGVSRSTVKAAIGEAKRLGLITVEERRATGFRNLSNIVRVVSPEWTAWLQLARKGSVLNTRPILSKGGGVKFSSSTPTQISTQGKTRTRGTSGRRSAEAGASPRAASRVACA